MKIYYLGRLATFRAVIDENIELIQQRGWKGQLERQMLLNTKRRSLGSKLNPVCAESIESHLKAASEVRNIAQFRVVEGLYSHSLASCELQGVR